jgi:sugar/nucleoside kinase (ribokinase family)
MHSRPGQGYKPPSNSQYDIVTIGAVTVDFTQRATERFLHDFKIAKGLSTLIPAEMFAALNEDGQTDSTLKTIGGVSTNIGASIAMNGGKVALIGKTGNDDNGRFYARQIEQYGIDYTAVIDMNAPTTALMNYITPDKAHSFAVLGGSGCRIKPEDIDLSLLERAKITHIETFMLQSEEGCATADYLADTVNRLGGKLAISLNSAPLLIEKRELVQSLITRADIVIGNINEFKALYNLNTDKDALGLARSLRTTIALTQGSRNAYIMEDGRYHVIPVKKERQVVDSSGAGDQFAAGLLKGLADNYSGVDAARQGALWATGVLRHYGALPQKRPPTLRVRPRAPTAERRKTA